MPAGGENGDDNLFGESSVFEDSLLTALGEILAEENEYGESSLFEDDLLTALGEAESLPTASTASPEAVSSAVAGSAQQWQTLLKRPAQESHSTGSSKRRATKKKVEVDPRQKNIVGLFQSKPGSASGSGSGSAGGDGLSPQQQQQQQQHEVQPQASAVAPPPPQASAVSASSTAPQSTAASFSFPKGETQEKKKLRVYQYLWSLSKDAGETVEDILAAQKAAAKAKSTKAKKSKEAATAAASNASQKKAAPDKKTLVLLNNRSVHYRWDERRLLEMKDLARRSVKLPDPKAEPPVALVRICAIVASLYDRMPLVADLNPLVESFYQETTREETIKVIWDMFFDETKDLMEQSSLGWKDLQQVQRGGLIDTSKQGVYIIFIETRDNSRHFYIGSAASIGGFNRRVNKQHRNWKYRKAVPQTSLYRLMDVAKRVEVDVLGCHSNTSYCQLNKYGQVIVKIMETIAMDAFGSLAAERATLVGNDMQFGLSWPHSLVSTELDMENLNTDRGYAGLNKSLPYCEGVSIRHYLWDSLEEGRLVGVDSAPEIMPKASFHLNHTSFWFNHEQTAKIREHGTKNVWIQMEIEHEGKPHPNRYAIGLEPFDQDGELHYPEAWERAMSLAIRARIPRPDMNPPYEDIWMTWDGCKAPSVRRTRLGLAKFCMSLIEHIEGHPQSPAGPERVDLQERIDTEDPKVWTLDDSEDRYTRLAYAFAGSNIAESETGDIFTCPFCDSIIEEGRHDLRGHAAEHFRKVVKCKFALMEQSGFTQEEMDKEMLQCQSCGDLFGSERFLLEHWQHCGTCASKMLELEQEGAADLLGAKFFPCPHCSRVLGSEHQLELHFDTRGATDCRRMEEERRAAEGLAPLPEPKIRCPGCSDSFDRLGRLHQHLVMTTYVKCLLVENKNRALEGKKLFVPTSYWCHTCKSHEARWHDTTVPYFGEGYGALRKHYKKTHGIECPLSEEAAKQPPDFMPTLDVPKGTLVEVLDAFIGNI